MPRTVNVAVLGFLNRSKLPEEESFCINNLFAKSLIYFIYS